MKTPFKTPSELFSLAYLVKEEINENKKGILSQKKLDEFDLIINTLENFIEDMSNYEKYHTI